MRLGGWMTGSVLGAWFVIAVSGCVSVQEHRRLQAQNRSMAADKEALAQDLFDTRNANDSLRQHAGVLERELGTKGELLANLRSENEILDDMRKMALSELEGATQRQRLGDIAIVGPKLPEALDAALKGFADQHPTLVAYDSGRGNIKWKADLLFALGSDVVKESSMEALRGFTEVINSPAAKDFEVIVVGHTDNRPIVRPKTKERHPTNWHLSAHRAISVANILQRFGYPSQRVGIMGCGEYRPVADNSTQKGCSQNRRVEIYLVPRGTIVHASADAGGRAEG